MVLWGPLEFFGARELQKLKNANAIEDFDNSETFPLSRACEARFYGVKGQKLRERLTLIASFYRIWECCKREGRKTKNAKNSKPYRRMP